MVKNHLCKSNLKLIKNYSQDLKNSMFEFFSHNIHNFSSYLIGIVDTNSLSLL